MKSSRLGRRVRLAADSIEYLEPRTFLSATLTTQIPAQTIAAGQAPSPIDLTAFFHDPQISGTVVNFETNLPAPNNNLPFQLTDSATPLNVANFLQYVNSGEYNDTIIHRLIPGFIVQGGGYTPDGVHINQFAPVQGEAATATLKNTTGTIAMALTGTPSDPQPNSGTSEWFFNLANNTELDNASDGGPFTAFGQVIYNGINTLSTINSLETVNDTGIANGAGPNLPVQNFSGTAGSTVSSVSPNQYITVTPEVVPNGLTYSVSSSNPAVVTGSVSGTSLSLTPGGGGTANITVTASDFGGGTATSTFAVQVANNSNVVTIGASGAKSLVYVDADGTTATVSMKGPGSASVDFTGSGFSQITGKKGITMNGTGLGVASITTAGTTAATTLSIGTAHGTKAISVGNITTDADKAITGKGVTLTGNLTSTASIGSVTIAGASGGAINAVSLGNFAASGAFADSVTLSGTTSLNGFKSRSLSTSTWTVAGSVKSIATGATSGWTPTFAGAVKQISVKGDLDTSTLSFTGTGVDLASLKVTGAINNSLINAQGSLGTVSATSLSSSNIYAGVETGNPAPTLPATAANFSAMESIASVKLKNTPTSFANSNIAASAIGSLSLGTLVTNNNGQPAGVAAMTIKSITATAGKKFTLHKLDSTSDVATLLSNLGVTLGDIVIRLL